MPLYNKIYREDVLAHAYAQCHANKGAPSVDRQNYGALPQGEAFEARKKLATITAIDITPEVLAALGSTDGRRHAFASTGATAAWRSMSAGCWLRPAMALVRWKRLKRTNPFNNWRPCCASRSSSLPQPRPVDGECWTAHVPSPRVQKVDRSIRHVAARRHKCPRSDTAANSASDCNRSECFSAIPGDQQWLQERRQCDT